MNMGLQSFSRLRQVVAHVSGAGHSSNTSQNESTSLSITSGPSHPSLTSETIGGLLSRQSRAFADRCAIKSSWTKRQLSYRELNDRSRALAKGLISLGLERGEHIGIVSGNCSEYVEVIMAAGIVGLPLVVLNTDYTNREIENALRQTSMSLRFLFHTQTGVTMFLLMCWPICRLPSLLQQCICRIKKHDAAVRRTI